MYHRSVASLSCPNLPSGWVVFGLGPSWVVADLERTKPEQGGGLASGLCASTE
jgi:hypothetical protein